jgi:L-lactate dehydrogenase complex protein LldF
MRPRSEQIQTLSENAIDDGNLQRALQNAGPLLKSGRNAGFADLRDPEELRQKAHQIKKKALDRLDEYLEHFEAKVTQLGGTVHWAGDAEEARRLISDLALERGVKTIVKGKSMMTEEIALNQGLIARGIEVFETDLGEFIIQLAGEPPSHIAAPAIHKTKQQVSQLFFEHLGIGPLDDIREMTMAARKLLRQKFLTADMGITGVNFAVAESGSIVLIENEGNIRISTTLPKIHVAVMGFEKLVPTLEDLGVFIKLLARSATGQKLTSYMSIINGTRRPGERDGAAEFHLVIVDNGRSKILADRDLKETLYCIRCSACLSFCPVYLKIGGHSYGWIYSGPIGAILTPHLIDRKQAGQLPFASTLCGACARVCPVKIDIPRILVTLRNRYMEDADWKNPDPFLERCFVTLLAWIIKNRRLYEAFTWMVRKVQRPLLKTGLLDPVLPFLNRWRRFHEIPSLENKAFRQQWQKYL